MASVAGAEPGEGTRRGRHRLSSLLSQTPKGVWIMLVIALALRVLLVALTWRTHLTLDPSDFDRTAASIAHGHGYPPSNRAPGGGPSAFRPPAYPFFLAAVYVIAGHSAPALGRLVGAVLGVISVALIGMIALRLWGRRVAMVALLIAAIAPPLVVLSTALISEALFVPLVLAAVLTALEARARTRRLRWAIATGVLAGLAALTRTNGLILLVPLAFAFVRRPAWRTLRAWVGPAVVLLAAALTIAPWTIRNAVVFHAFIPISDETGYTLAGTYDQVSRANQRFPADWVEAEHGASPEYARILRIGRREHWNEPTYGSHLQAQALHELAGDPAYALKVFYWNAIRMFSVAEIRLARNNLHDTDIPLAPALALMNTAPLLEILAIGGLFDRRTWRVPRWFWLVPLLLATNLFVTGFLRFRAPIDPFVVMLDALCLVGLWETLPGRRKESRPPGQGKPLGEPGGGRG